MARTATITVSSYMPLSKWNLPPRFYKTASKYRWFLWCRCWTAETHRRPGQTPRLWTKLGRHGYHQPDTRRRDCETLLDRGGDQRFLARSAWFQKLVQEQGPDQTLYEGLLEGLGYRFNQQPFVKLAQRAPYAAHWCGLPLDVTWENNEPNRWNRG